MNSPQSEQNAQRPELFNRVEHCAYKDGCHPVQSHPLCSSCAEWYRTKFFQFDSPAPQTEAVDVSEEIYHCAALILEPHYDNSQVASFQKDVERAGKYIREGIVTPLTQRIGILEKESEVRRVAAEANYDRAIVAEARVNDLEQKLAGALKVTTENTIQHMTGKVFHGWAKA